MGTTAQKLTYLNETKQELKQAINNLGGSITDETTFRQYVNQLDGVYDVLPKTSFQEGTEVTIENGLKGKIDFDDGKVGFGQASQETTTGTQRINSNENIASTTKNGVTYSLQDGLFTFNGTASAGFDIILSNKVSLEAGAYTMAPSDESGSYTGVFGKYAYVAEVGVGNIIDGGQVRMVAYKTLENDYNNKVQLHFYIASGATFNNYKFKVNLVKGTYTSATIPSWEKYTGGYQSPSPNWEQEVKCVAGRNKADPSKLNLGKTLSNTGALIDLHNRTTSFQNPVDPNTPYTLSVNSGYQIGNLFYYDKNKNYSSSVESAWANSKVITIPNNAYYVSFATARTDNATMTESDVEALHLQLEEGSIAHPYLPYNTIQETIRGKNIFEPVLKIDNTEISKHYCTMSVVNQVLKFISTGGDMYFGDVTPANSTYNKGKGVKIYRNGNAKLSFKMSNSLINKNYITAYNSSGVSLGYSSTLTDEGTYTFPTDCEYVTFRIGRGNTTSGEEFETTIMVAYGDTIPDYEPYVTPRTYQFSLGNNKFYGLTNTYKDIFVTDRVTKKWYISRDIDEVVLDSTMTWNSPATHQFNVSNISPSMLASDDGSTSKCNYFTSIVSTASDSEFRNYIANNNLDNVYDIHMNGSGIRFWTTKFSTLEQFTTWLDGVNLKVLVVRPDRLTEITGDLATQLEAFWNGQSNNGTTIIESNGDLPMIIKVRALKGES